MKVGRIQYSAELNVAGIKYGEDQEMNIDLKRLRSQLTLVKVDKIQNKSRENDIAQKAHLEQFFSKREKVYAFTYEEGNIDCNQETDLRRERKL